jgi:hypothetical protein
MNTHMIIERFHHGNARVVHAPFAHRSLWMPRAEPGLAGRWNPQAKLIG